MTCHRTWFPSLPKLVLLWTDFLGISLFHSRTDFGGEEGMAMTRASGVVCAAAVLLLAAAGCDSLHEFQFSAAALLAPTGSDRVVAGSLESVTASTQDALRGLGLSVTATREGEAVRLRAAGQSGQHFDLVLTRTTSEHGELTHVCFEWERDRDESMEIQILSQVEVRARS
jgi:hypothetical protein